MARPRRHYPVTEHAFVVELVDRRLGLPQADVRKILKSCIDHGLRDSGYYADLVDVEVKSKSAVLGALKRHRTRKAERRANG